MPRPDRRCVNRSDPNRTEPIDSINRYENYYYGLLLFQISPQKALSHSSVSDTILFVVCLSSVFLSSQFLFVAVLLAAFDFKRIWKLCFLVSARFVIVIIIDLSKLSNCLLCNWVSDLAFYAPDYLPTWSHTHRSFIYLYICVCFSETHFLTTAADNWPSIWLYISASYQYLNI